MLSLRKMSGNSIKRDERVKEQMNPVMEMMNRVRKLNLNQMMTMEMKMDQVAMTSLNLLESMKSSSENAKRSESLKKLPN